MYAVHIVDNSLLQIFEIEAAEGSISEGFLNDMGNKDELVNDIIKLIF